MRLCLVTYRLALIASLLFSAPAIIAADASAQAPQELQVNCAINGFGRGECSFINKSKTTLSECHTIFVIPKNFPSLLNKAADWWTGTWMEFLQKPDKARDTLISFIGSQSNPVCSGNVAPGDVVERRVLGWSGHSISEICKHERGCAMVTVKEE
jgi:hypothetical protein